VFQSGARAEFRGDVPDDLPAAQLLQGTLQRKRRVGAIASSLVLLSSVTRGSVDDRSDQPGRCRGQDVLPIDLAPFIAPPGRAQVMLPVIDSLPPGPIVMVHAVAPTPIVMMNVVVPLIVMMILVMVILLMIVMMILGERCRGKQSKRQRRDGQ
jgi:hypothetical protein